MDVNELWYEALYVKAKKIRMAEGRLKKIKKSEQNDSNIE